MIGRFSAELMHGEWQAGPPNSLQCECGSDHEDESEPDRINVTVHVSTCAMI